MSAAIFSLIVAFCSSTCLAQRLGSLEGVVKAAATRQPIVGANVLIEGTAIGAASDTNGYYTVRDIPAGSYSVRASHVAYQSQTLQVGILADTTLTLNFSLMSREIEQSQIVVSASRRAKKITDAASTIDVVTAREIDVLPSFSATELLARQKGIDYSRTGVGEMRLNARGFNNAINPKMVEINDGRISSLILSLSPFGVRNTTVVKEDIERIEVLLGPSSALYGPNAQNGVVNTITKDPRTSQGTVVALGAGNQKLFTGRFRHANVLNSRFAYKISSEYTRGEDFDYVDTVYVGGVGHPEFEPDRRFTFLRGEAALYYSLNPESDVILAYGGSNSNILTPLNAGRTRSNDFQIHFLQVRYVSRQLCAQVYRTWNNTDNTYSVNQRTQNYWSFINVGFSDEEARARSFHEAWSGTMYDGRAISRESFLIIRSRRENAELQYTDSWGQINLVTGAQWQRDIADNNNQVYRPIELNQTSAYGQVDVPLGASGIRMVLAARVDHHEKYGTNFVPKAALTYATEASTARLTYGKGIAAPTIGNLSSYVGQLLGNSEGFTLSNGTKIPRLQVETIQTFEFGYKGSAVKHLYIDANAYYNISQNFISPPVNIATGGALVTYRGNQPIQDFFPGTPAAGLNFLTTYLNFGKVSTYGADFSVTYSVLDWLDCRLNYSYFDFSLDKSDLRNDGNKDGIVQDTDLPINTPKHKLGVGVNAIHEKYFGAIFARWVQAYDFFSGIHVAAKTNPGIIYNGSPVIEDTRVGRSFNYGPLGGSASVDLNAGFRVSENVVVSVGVVNVFNAKVREFVGSPWVRRLISGEVKYSF